MKNIQELLLEANKEFNIKLKIKDSAYDESDRKDFVFGWVTAAYQELFEKLKLINKMTS